MAATVNATITNPIFGNSTQVAGSITAQDATLNTIATTSVNGAQAANDDAHKVLTELFTANWDNLFTGGGLSSGTTATALFDIFGYMNAVTLVAVSILLFYVITVGIIGTAHEGEALGKRYSTLWTPIRSVSAIAMLMPLPNAGGISLLQALLLMCISAGSYSANQIWDKVLLYMKTNGGTLTATMPMDYGIKSRDLAFGILEAEVAQKYVMYINKAGNLPVKELFQGGNQVLPPVLVDPSTGECSTEDGGWDSECEGFVNMTPGKGGDIMARINFDSPTKDLKFKFGQIVIPKTASGGSSSSTTGSSCSNAATIGDQPFEDLKQAVYSLAGDLAEVAEDLTALYNPDNTSFSSGTFDPKKFQTAVNKYNKAVFQIAKGLADQGDPDFQCRLDAFYDAAGSAHHGWIQAGAWYWTIAGMQDRLQAVIDKEPALHPLDMDAIVTSGHGDVIDLIHRLDYYKSVTDDQLRKAAQAGANQTTEMAQLRESINPYMVRIPNMIVEAVTKGDPVANLRAFGTAAVNMVTATTLPIFTGNAGSGDRTANISTFANALMPSAMKNDPNTAKMVGSLATPVAMMAVPLASFFLYVAYYLPSIPFIMWMIGVVGWLVMIMEAVCIAPLWAAAHAIPEGEGFAGQHGKQGYMLFMNVLMRPSLMVTGLFIAMFTIKGVSWLVGQGLEIYFQTQSESILMNPIAVIAMTVIGISLIIKLVTKCFELITWLPDNALRWIGHSAPSFGEAGQESQMHGGLSGAAQGGLQQGMYGQSQMGNTGLGTNGLPIGQTANAGRSEALAIGNAPKAGGHGDGSLDLTKADSGAFGGANEQGQNKAIFDANVGQANGVLSKGGMSIEAGKAGAARDGSQQSAQSGHGHADLHSGSSGSPHAAALEQENSPNHAQHIDSGSKD